MLELSEVCVNAGGRTLLPAVSFSLGIGEVLGVVGPRASGKTTLLRVLAGEIRPSSGRARFAGRDLARQPLAELARQCAYLPQRLEREFTLGALDVIAIGRMPHRARESRHMSLELARDVLDFMGLSQLAEHRYRDLSHADRQRVQLARMFAQLWSPAEGGSRLLLLDEPSEPLGTPQLHERLTLLRRFAERGVAVVVVSLGVADTLRHTDHLLVLEAGRGASAHAPITALRS